MNSIGAKIKEALTGHHDNDATTEAKTPDVNAPGAFPSDDVAHRNLEGVSGGSDGHNKLTKPAAGHTHQETGVGAGKEQHAPIASTHQPGHHQHEHPQHEHPQHEPHGTHHDPEVETKQATSAAGNYPYWGDLPADGQGHPHHHEGRSGNGAGTTGTGTGAAGAGGQSHDVNPEVRYSNSTGRSHPGQDEVKSRVDASTGQFTGRDEINKSAVAGAGVAGAAGAGYLASRHERNPQDGSDQTDSTTSGPSSNSGPGQLDQSYESSRPIQASASQGAAGHSASGRGLSYPGEDHHKEEALGAGAAGLAGASYLAHRHKDQSSHEYEERSASANQTNPTTSGGVHNTVIGAGSDEDSHARRFPLVSGSVQDTAHNNSANTTRVGPQVSSSGQQSISNRDLDAARSGDDRNSHAFAAAAAAGAGTGVIHEESKHHHRHHHHDDAKDDQSSKYATGPSSAYASAQQASRQNASAPANAAAQQQGNSHDYRGVEYGAATGTAAGAGLAAYGLGKKHNQSPGTYEHQVDADRRSGASSHIPSNRSGAGTGVGTGPGHDATSAARLALGNSSAGLPASHGTSAKVFHACDKCGHDNDISRYFSKGATFHLDQ